MDPWESHQRASVLDELLGQLGMTEATIAEWWNRPTTELNGRTPAESWHLGQHLDVERVVANICEDADALDRRCRRSLGVPVAALRRTA
jgi:hypothetical protein